MLAGSLGFELPSSPVHPRTESPPVQQRQDDSPPRRFTPQSAPVRYRAPPKPRRKARVRVQEDPKRHDSPERGDVREIVQQVRRRAPPSVGAGLDAAINDAAAPVARPRKRKAHDWSNDPTRWLQAMLHATGA